MNVLFCRDQKNKQTIRWTCVSPPTAAEHLADQQFSSGWHQDCGLWSVQDGQQPPGAQGDHGNSRIRWCVHLSSVGINYGESLWLKCVWFFFFFSPWDSELWANKHSNRHVVRNSSCLCLKKKKTFQFNQKCEPLPAVSSLCRSIGVLAYVMLTGISPFLGDDKQETFLNISQLNVSYNEEELQQLNQGAVAFIQTLLHKHPQSVQTRTLEFSSSKIQSIFLFTYTKSK